jgi:hypothetical protein
MMPMGTKSWMNFSPWFKNLSLFLLRCFFLKALRFQTVSWNLALFNGRGRLLWEPGCPPQGVHPSKSGWIILERSTMLLMGKSTNILILSHFLSIFIYQQNGILNLLKYLSPNMFHISQYPHR